MKIKKCQLHKTKLICEDCLTDQEVQCTTCPYDGEMKNKITEVHLCKKCEHDRAMEI